MRRVIDVATTAAVVRRTEHKVVQIKNKIEEEKNRVVSKVFIEIVEFVFGINPRDKVKQFYIHEDFGHLQDFGLVNRKNSYLSIQNIKTCGHFSSFDFIHTRFKLIYFTAC